MRSSTGTCLNLLIGLYVLFSEDTVCLRKMLLFNCLEKAKVVLMVNVRRRKSVIRFSKCYVNNLIYTREDDIYRINQVEGCAPQVEKGADKHTIGEVVDRSTDESTSGASIISNSNWGNLEQLENFGNLPDEGSDNGTVHQKQFEPSDYELQMYKNKWKIPLYWIKKLERLKNMNAINCVEHLKDDNLLYFDNYKNKGLLKFLNEEKKKYSNCIILVRVGDFYETYGLDCIFLIEFLNIKKMNNKLSCGFIKTSINKALHILTSNNLNVCVYEEMNEKSLKMKKRYLSQIVTPEFPIYLNNIQYCQEESNNVDESSDKGNSLLFQTYDLENHFVVKEIVCIYIESKNIFSLSKINLSLKTISIFDNITFDVLNVYLKNTNFLKAYIHQHHNTSFTKKITQLFRVENYYLFNNFSNSLRFHLFILEKLKRQINVEGLFRLIRNKSVFRVKGDNCDTSVEQTKDAQTYYSYCTPLNIFTSYNMGVYRQNNCYDNRSSYLFYNIVDASNSDSNSININESMEFFKNVFLFYPPFQVTKHIRYINEYIKKNQENLIIPNVRPFRNNIIVTLLSNLKADHTTLKRIFTNVQAVHKCMDRFEYSLLTSIFRVMNHQNSFNLNVIKFYHLLKNIENILEANLQIYPSNFLYVSEIPSFNEFVFYHESEVHNLINENLLLEQNKGIIAARKDLLESIIQDYADVKENGEEKKYDLDDLQKIIKVDNSNDVIGIKKKKKNFQSSHFFHPLNKKSDVMKNVYVTEHVQRKIKNYLSAIDKKKRRISEVIRGVNVQLSSSVHILSFVSNFLQIIQALYNHTINSIKRKWSLPICKHLTVRYTKKIFDNIDEKLSYMQKCLYEEEENTVVANNSDGKNDPLNDPDEKHFIELSEEEEKKISQNVDPDSVGEIKKIYKKKNYMNDSLTYILGAKPYNMNKDNLIKYDIFLKKKKFILLTGKNMSGKTTLSFTLLCILFLANLGMYAPCEEKSIVSKFREFYSLKNVNYQEQIENMSLFREQTYYINSIIEEIKENYPFSRQSSRDGEVFILFDEPCIATTPVDNAVIISALSDYLQNYCGIIITHNYDLLRKICLNENIVFKKINESINYLTTQAYEQRATLENGVCKNSEALETCRHTNVDGKMLELLTLYQQKYKLIHNLSDTLYYRFIEYVKCNDVKDVKKNMNDFFEYCLSVSLREGKTHKGDFSEGKKMMDIFEHDRWKNMAHGLEFLQRGDLEKGDGKREDYSNVRGEELYVQSFSNDSEDRNMGSSTLDMEMIRSVAREMQEKELTLAIEQIEDAVKRKVFKIEMNEDVPIFFKNKSVVYILCIFSQKKKKPYFYIGISDNISERLKCHTRNLLKNKNLLKNEKKNNILNYKFDMDSFYTLLFHVENKMFASKYERELSDLLKNGYDILSK
ncbi:DNA mismatch repair protein, putative [Plasmodium knowlesi strain H]|uniref:DNA mismatch repair protein, putative n=3 Tax=Plasmodium knowlesi TaxID=5850 RepID=A0A5E7X6I0_PLAKH|nr:DNA mismatch repair protein, putative [Plasmodium knowlesi strain H]OTN67714.1 putative DNA mismatch repair protein [Plasmodium knowlesi]CAA9990553.1 DNA mismatch repair protein, putative [Plasmodium knowlesi strain H]SBO19811.1 DNA mismatch repair protein, putative [Plasmodium knowlesi strain H]SBO22372.1 DNA mismatch repair protein, putative [Plasmodium knowlesi strain H]VVS80027.1 DNA mismatch repair protein, putative [Plasmodium knowlesi strain H]